MLKRIGATMIVDRESHKGMLIGAGGRTLKEIGTEARVELEEMLGRARVSGNHRQGRARLDARSAQARGVRT